MLVISVMTSLMVHQHNLWSIMNPLTIVNAFNVCFITFRLIYNYVREKRCVLMIICHKLCFNFSSV